MVDKNTSEREALEKAKDFLLYLNQSGVLTGNNKLKKHLVKFMEDTYQSCEVALNNSLEQATSHPDLDRIKQPIVKESEEHYLRNIDGKIFYSPMDLTLIKKACEDAITPIGNMSDSPVLSGILKGQKFYNAMNPREILAVVNELEQFRQAHAQLSSNTKHVE